MLYKNSYFTCTHLINLLNPYYVLGSVLSAEICIAKKKGNWEKVRALDVLKEVGSEIGKIIQKSEAITWLILSSTDDN